jgi:hypothetical protein
MALTITPEALYFGAPTTLTFNSVDVGATIDAPKVSFEVTNYTPEFQGAKGPVKGTVITTKVVPSVEFTVNEMTAEKIAWAMPGSSGSGTITWTPGRIADAAYMTLELVGTGLDGRTIAFTLYNAMSSESQELVFGDDAVAGLKMKFTGHYDSATPTVAPFQIVISA